MFVALPMALKVTLIQCCMLFLNSCKENVNEVFHDPFSSVEMLTLPYIFQSFDHSVNNDHAQRGQDK